MQLKKLEVCLAKYKEFLLTPAAEERLYIWESQRHFQEVWDVDAADFAVMYDRSLQNSYTKRLWKRERFEPKRMMLEFIGEEPDFVRTMFKDLFNEEKSVENRVDRFVFYCDELLSRYKRKYPVSIENNHYHQEYEMIALYLAFRYPEAYACYDADAFRQTLELLAAPNVPVGHDLPRYFKVCKTVFTFMSRDEELMQRHRQRLNPEKHYTGNSYLQSYDFMCFCREAGEKLFT